MEMLHVLIYVIPCSLVDMRERLNLSAFVCDDNGGT